LRNLGKQNELLKKNESKLLAEFQSEKTRLEREILDLKLEARQLNANADRRREEEKIKEQERAEKERLKILERERREREKCLREALERDRLEKERLERERSENLERERSEKMKAASEADDLASRVQKEMKFAEASVADANSRMNLLMQRMKDTQDAIWLDSSFKVTNAVALLIKYAIQCQTEIVFHGRGSGNPDSFYKKDSQWTDGLISAAKAVAKSMSMLCDTAEGIMSSKFQLEQVIVVAREVASATIHLVSASRVKAIPMSKIQPLLEDASKQVIAETKDVVQEIESQQKRNKKSLNLEDFSKMTIDPTQSKDWTQDERDLQVKILLLERTLAESQQNYKDMQMLFKPMDDLFSAEAHQRNIEEMNIQINIQSLEKELSVTREQLAASRRQHYQQQVQDVALLDF
jgi:hypothetical protein